MALEQVTLSSGQVISMHAKGTCQGPFCPVHKPSEHHMRSWPLVWRDDVGIFERICEHGVGHPDPDTLEFLRVHRGDKEKSTAAIHGCDKCCIPPWTSDWRPHDPQMTEVEEDQWLANEYNKDV